MKAEAVNRWSAQPFVGLIPRLPLICAAVAAVALLVAIPQRIAASGYLTYVSGAWATLADDVAHGVLYRPLVSEIGYGGTRYMPLQPVLHGLLVELGIPIRPAGHILSLLAALVLVGGGALAFLRRGASPVLAWSAGCLALASRTAFMAVAGVRGDLLPLALGVMGLALTPRTRKESVLLPAVFFSMALLTKPTLLWAPAGALIALASVGEIRVAAKLAALVATFALAGLGVAVWASHGEMLTSFRACASGGSISLAGLAALSYVRPGDLAWIFGGVGLTLFRGRRGFGDPIGAAALVCVPLTVLLFTSRGIHVNHLIEPTSMGALSLCAVLADSQAPKAWAHGLLVVATLLGVTESLLLDAMLTKKGELDQAAAALPSGKDPVLSEQPWIPLLAGERPFLLDAYSLEQTRRSTPAVDQDLLTRLDRCGFRAVVLIARAETATDWYAHSAFGAGFREHLLSNYSFSSVVGAHAFYLPRCGSPARLPGPLQEVDMETVFDRGTRPGLLNTLLARARSVFR